MWLLVQVAAVALVVPLTALADGASTRHKVKKGESLSALCRVRYGSEHYAGLLALRNRVAQTTLEVGREIVLPPFDQLIESEEIGERQGAAALLVEAAVTLRAVEPRLWPLVGRPQRRLSKNDGASLTKAASLADQSVALLQRHPVPPKSVIGQARSAASLLRSLASSGPDAYGYDIADSHRRLAYALEYLVRDARLRSPARRGR